VVKGVYTKLESADSHMVAYASREDPSVPVTPEFVRMTMTRCLLVKAMSASASTLTALTYIDMGGKVPSWVVRSTAIPTAMTTGLTVKAFFSAVRPPDEDYDEGDATELGLLLAHRIYSARQGLLRRINAEKLKGGVSMMFEENTALFKVKSDHIWVEEMILEMYVPPKPLRAKRSGAERAQSGARRQLRD
jgi:hypothetical protein